MQRPNYLGIGAIKAGTTWASDVLESLPEIFMAHGKELHYFSHNYQNGLDWYLKKFSSARNHSALGEFSVTYMNGSTETAQRIFEFDPRLRLIVSVRDPVERAFSQYRWEKQMGKKLPPFREALEIRPDLVSNSCYASNLRPYWKLFGAEQFFYIRHMDIKKNPDLVCQNLYRFLGVGSNYLPGMQDEVVGETIQPVNQGLENLRVRAHQAVMRYGLESIITLYRKLGLSSLYRRLNNDESKREALGDQDKSDLNSLFVDDMKEFERQTGVSVC